MLPQLLAPQSLEPLFKAPFYSFIRRNVGCTHPLAESFHLRRKILFAHKASRVAMRVAVLFVSLENQLLRRGNLCAVLRLLFPPVIH